MFQKVKLRKTAIAKMYKIVFDSLISQRSSKISKLVLSLSEELSIFSPPDRLRS